MRRSGALCCGLAVLAGAGCGTGSDPASLPEPIEPVRSSAPSSSGKPPGSFTVVATGDVLIHPALTEQATADGSGKRDFGPLFAGVRPAIEAADLAVCHLEVPLADADGPFRGYPDFSAPPEVATALAATGYDTCSTASNHTLDQGKQGVIDTLDALDAAGIGHTGSARSKKEADTPLVRDVAGVKVGQVSFTFGFNQGTALPQGSPWLANELETDAVLDAARASKAAGAEVVIASLHWGIEDRHDPTAEQRQTAAKLLADPAIDLIVGHHAHVVQPFEKINGKWVAYGLGNHVAKHEEPRGTTEEGAIARFRFVKGGGGWTVEAAEYLPTLVDLGPPIRLRDLTTDTEADPARRTEALERTDRVVRGRGAAEAGLTRP